MVLMPGSFLKTFFYSHQDVYVLNWGESAWQPRNTGLPTTLGNGLAFIGSALNDIDTAYVAGQREDESPMIYKTTNGGTSWQSVLQVQQNLNIETGWAGHQGIASGAMAAAQLDSQLHLLTKTEPPSPIMASSI
ncbi:MAG: hypothetical protein UZ16_OP3001001784 [Candidatus Hinthialibacteria bacterium OLB16]|nr:MAG: hypothetical protein UZ16_OP3001001784 [Candidatus Hinthialibacteria bacterium OLB16]